MSIRDFAAHLGISERMVSKWEAGGESVIPRPINQSALDTSLTTAGEGAQKRFASHLGVTPTEPLPVMDRVVTPNAASHFEPSPIPIGDEHHIRHSVDGKLMALVSGGTFFAGTDSEPKFLAAFYIDVYPTTNADYARYVAATSSKPPQHWPDGKPPTELLNHPVVFVDWHDANAYCQWAGKHLPTSLQWEKAARGTRGDIYPWGNQRTPAKCNCREHRIDSTTPVDRYASGVSQYGIYDLCGNVWEWCSTESAPGRYELKGSAFTSPFLRCTPALFNDADAGMLDDDTGFRCIAFAAGH